MTSPDDSKPGLSIVARAEERWLTPLKRNAFATRTWNLVTVAMIGAVYAGIIGFIFYRDAHTPIETAKIEEIPVEVVPPPPPKPPAPKPPAPKPPPQAKPEIEKPASSAPRAPSEEKIETEKLDDATRAPKADTPPKDGETAPPPAPPAAPADAADRDKEVAPAKPDVLKEDAEALAKAVPLPPQKPEKLTKAPPKAKPRREQTAVERLAGRSELPDYKLARPTKKAPITGGHEDNRYLANVFAKIMSRYRPVAFPPDGASEVVVAFDVDDDGSILTMTIARSSGDQDVDAAAVAAVSRASPLPPLPRGAPHGLVVRITADSWPAARPERGGGE